MASLEQHLSIMSEGLPGTTFSWGLATGYWTFREYDTRISPDGNT
jgi:hypothetical protein